MNYNTQPKQFIVIEDSVLVPELSYIPPTGLEYTGELALQARMGLFDAIHGTDYRSIRNNLVEQQKRKVFEKRIGLIAIHKK
jgi:hypothetical protein